MELNEQEDRELLQKLKWGDEKSFRKVYLKYHKQLYSVALKYLRNKELAEDALQDIFVKLWNQKEKLDRTGSLRGFLFTAVKNHVLNMISSRQRKLKKHIELTYEKKAESSESDNVIALSQYRKVYREAVGRLPEKRREVFKLKIREGLTNHEVATYLGLSINTVKSQYYKASKYIRTYVKEHIDFKTAG